MYKGTVIDARFLAILKNQVPKLPGNVRVFVTSRQDEKIMESLPQSPHVRHHSMEIEGKANMHDIGIYIRYRLTKIAKAKKFGNWPTEAQILKFQLKSEGLFIWASTICEFLASSFITRTKPEFESILQDHSPVGLEPFKKMEALYDVIIDRCFSTRTESLFYQGIIGAVMAAKVPLSMSALQALIDWKLETLDVTGFIRQSPIRTLLMGHHDETTPIRILHLSFRDYLTDPGRSVGQSFIDEKHHSARLALHCIEVMNREFIKDIPGTGYLQDDTPYAAIPKIDVAEEVWYACQFWLEHLADVQDLKSSPNVLDALRAFLSEYLVFWLEIMASKGHFKPLLQPVLRESLHIISPEKPGDIFPVDFPRILYRLSKRLSQLGRPDEAYRSSLDALELVRSFEPNPCPDTFNPALILTVVGHTAVLAKIHREQESFDLAEKTIFDLNALYGYQEDPLLLIYLARLHHNASVTLVTLKRQSESLQAARKAVEIGRRIPLSDELEMLKDLPAFLSNLAQRLSVYPELNEESIVVAEEAVSIYRDLAPRHHRIFQGSLAESLTTLAKCLSTTPRYTESLAIMQEAVLLRESLAAEYPYLQSELARCLRFYSNFIDDSVERTVVVERVVELYRMLSSDFPDIFTWELAASLHRLAGRYCDLDKDEDALMVITEALGLYRVLILRDPVRGGAELCEALDTYSVLLADDREKYLAVVEERNLLSKPDIVDASWHILESNNGSHNYEPSDLF
ncbi:hypothetical protein C8J56DRAFT_1054786 [Mycena floridula]|nr:hypothetical protein C8J56DRAFT_1054786 [Mycena floridula]